MDVMTTPTVELIYDRDCPNITAAREQLKKALRAAGMAPRWQEWEVNHEDAPAHVRGYGSPTIMVAGVDVSGDPAPGTDACCRIYAGAGGNPGVPPLDAIVAALRAVVAGV